MCYNMHEYYFGHGSSPRWRTVSKIIVMFADPVVCCNYIFRVHAARIQQKTLFVNTVKLKHFDLWYGGPTVYVLCVARHTHSKHSYRNMIIGGEITLPSKLFTLHYICFMLALIDVLIHTSLSVFLDVSISLFSMSDCT